MSSIRKLQALAGCGRWELRRRDHHFAGHNSSFVLRVLSYPRVHGCHARDSTSKARVEESDLCDEAAHNSKDKLCSEKFQRSSGREILYQVCHSISLKVIETVQICGGLRSCCCMVSQMFNKLSPPPLSSFCPGGSLTPNGLIMLCFLCQIDSPSPLCSSSLP